MKLRNQILHRARIQFNNDLYKEDLGLISKARKICNHPLLLFWDDAEQKTTFDLLSKDSEEIKTKEQLIDLIFENREKSGKLKILEKLIIEWKNEGENFNKVLIFSQTKIILNIISRILAQHSLDFKRIDGNTNVSKRMEIIKEFSEDQNCFAMILTTRVGGLGLNLTAANKVIIFDPDWNPMVDMQASDRAARKDKNKEVTVYRFVLTDTVEEFIYQKQIFKKFMADKILNNPSAKKIFKNKIFMEYLLSVPKSWRNLYKASELELDNGEERKHEKDKPPAKQSKFDFCEVKEIIMQNPSKRRDQKQMDKLFSKEDKKIVKISKKLLDKDKKLKKFLDNVVDEIRHLDQNSDKNMKDRAEEFVKEILTKEDGDNDKNEQVHLTIDEKLELLQLKSKTFNFLSNSKHQDDKFYNNIKLKSSLAFTEDEIDDR
eukprot:CAMPEP_0168348110 /NCGR_PEP_ID=MMETSP0213-20121227/19476_1 /TAXON_ID=151035 /ORGANISM="Euplotes harpa, Strain FSP1.4" /LENGTH=431 /DNA_ID=CAMNT_0008357499 /DNA_START=133 /DNA_END=1426 /DNA_ORIENTATION=-